MLNFFSWLSKSPQGPCRGLYALHKVWRKSAVPISLYFSSQSSIPLRRAFTTVSWSERSSASTSFWPGYLPAPSFRAAFSREFLHGTNHRAAELADALGDLVDRHFEFSIVVLKEFVKFHKVVARTHSNGICGFCCKVPWHRENAVRRPVMAFRFLGKARVSSFCAHWK